MADKFVIKAEVREGRGKNDARRLRREGKIPVSIYGGGQENTAAIADLKELAAILRTETGANTVFSLDIAGVGVSNVIFQDRQIDSVKGRLIHADLRRIARGEKIELTVPIHLVGDAAGLTEEGAVLSQPLRELKVLCEPSKAPEAINVDVTNLNVNESIHVSDLTIPDGVEVHELPETLVASVVVVKEVDLEPSPDTGAEPEVIGEEGGETEGGE